MPLRKPTVIDIGTTTTTHRVIVADRYRVTLTCLACELETTVGAGIVTKALRGQGTIACRWCNAKPKAPPQRPRKRAERYLPTLTGRRA